MYKTINKGKKTLQNILITIPYLRTSGPFYWHWLSLTQAQVIAPIKNCKMKLPIQSQTSTVQPFGNGEITSAHILLSIYLLVYAGIKVNRVNKLGPMCLFKT